MDDIEFLANLDSDDYEDIRTVLFRDKVISRVTLENGYMHFARAANGSYDPVCFNANKQTNGDFEIVRLDHEEILQFEKIVSVATLALSFKAYMIGHVSS